MMQKLKLKLWNYIILSMFPSLLITFHKIKNEDYRPIKNKQAAVYLFWRQIKNYINTSKINTFKKQIVFFK